MLLDKGRPTCEMVGAPLDRGQRLLINRLWAFKLRPSCPDCRLSGVTENRLVKPTVLAGVSPDRGQQIFEPCTLHPAL